MSVTSNALADASQIDWTVVAGAFATFVVTAIMTWLGLKKGKQKVEEGRTETHSIVGASLIENQAFRELTRALDDHTRELRVNSHELEENTRALHENTSAKVRHIDLILLRGKNDPI